MLRKVIASPTKVSGSFPHMCTYLSFGNALPVWFRISSASGQQSHALISCPLTMARNNLVKSDPFATCGVKTLCENTVAGRGMTLNKYLGCILIWTRRRKAALMEICRKKHKSQRNAVARRPCRHWSIRYGHAN